MAGFKDRGTGARSALLAGGALIVVAAGFGLWFVNQVAPPSDLAADTQPVAEATPAPLATEGTADTTKIEPEPDIAAAVDGAEPASGEIAQPVHPIVPTFDLLRVEPDGQALVAGQAAPGAQVALRLDGAELSATTADAQGNFVVLFVLDPSPVPRMLTMSSILSDLTEIPAAAEIALAPTVAPVAVAEPAIVAAQPAVSAKAAPDFAAGPSQTVDAPAALLVTKEGVNLLPPDNQPAAIDGQTPLAIDTISYTPTGEVQLAGHAAAGEFVRIYLDNAPLIDLPVGDDGRWASTMPMIAPGLYTLRVDALSQDGTVTARFETPFKRETSEALAAATQIEEPAAPLASAAPLATAEPAAESQAVAAPPAVAAAAIAPADEGEAAQIATVAAPSPVNPVSITVQPGFTLWGIASEQFGDGVLYVQVFEANKDKIRDPNLIYPGQIFVIPTPLQ